MKIFWLYLILTGEGGEKGHDEKKGGEGEERTRGNDNVVNLT